MDYIDKILYGFNLRYEKFINSLSGGVNIFDLNIDVVNFVVFILIFFLFLTYSLKAFQKDDINYKEYFARTIIVVIISSFLVSSSLEKGDKKILEGDVYTHNYFEQTLEDETSGTFNKINALNRGLVVEGVGSPMKGKSTIHGIGGLVEENKTTMNFYIDIKSVTEDFSIKGVNSNILSLTSGNLKTFISGLKNGNYGIKNFNPLAQYSLTAEGKNEIYKCIKSNKDNPNINCINFGKLFKETLKPQINKEGDIIYKTEKMLDSGKIDFLTNAINIDDLSVKIPSVKFGGASDYFLYDFNNLWVWKMLKIKKENNTYTLTPIIIPNLNMYYLDKNIKTLEKSSDNFKKRIGEEYKRIKSNACNSGSNCTFEDIYNKQSQFYAKDDIKNFIVAFSILKGGFNYSIIENSLTNDRIFINGKEYYTFLSFFDWLQNKGNNIFSLSNNNIGLNYRNNGNTLAYTYTVGDDNKRYIYDLGLLKENSFYKNFYGGVSEEKEIGIGETALMVILFLLYFVVLLFGGLFPVYIIYIILN